MKRIIALGIVVVLVAAAWTGAWFWGASFVTGYVKSLETADGVTTPKLVCKSFGIGGYPFGFDLTCAAPTITLADTTVTAAGLKASAEVYNPTHILVWAQSPVSIADAFSGSQSRLDFNSAEASARLDGWRIGRVSLIIEKPVWNDTVLDDRLLAKADHLEAHLIDVPDKHDAKAGLATVAEYAEIDALDAPGAGIASGKATLTSEISNLPDDVRTYGNADMLKRWQAADGMLTLNSLTGDDGATHIDASGNASLDGQGRLDGQLKLHSIGVVEKLSGAIPAQYKGLVIGSPAADGSYSNTVNVAAGVVFAGLLPAAVLPPLF